ncbi:Fungalysin metallopeptidase-domain-containing protein [Infundibulicybe gibba]|nr:Fungalysin metallopeptidase-domain-containing protein [Infundibulicybe gibba]
MPSFGMFLGSILLAIVCPLVAGGAHPKLVSSGPLIALSKYATHRSHVVAHGRRVKSFHPPTKFRTFGDGIDLPPPFGSVTLGLEEMAISIVQSQIGINSTNIHFRSGFSDGPGAFAYVRQSHEGVPFANAVANVALHNNRIVSFGSSFVETTNIAASTPSLDVQSVIPNAENALNGKFNGHAPTLEYLVQSDGSIALTHVVQIQNNRTGTWFEAFLDAHSGEILSVTDFVAKASYKVVPIWEENFYSGLVTLVDPQDLSASPVGWHSQGTSHTTLTAGNNVFAFKIMAGQATPTPETESGLVFDYTYVDTLDPIAEQNVDAARTNAFYIVNTMHDIAYKYGFTEKSFNFQMNNFGKGGRENDGVLMTVQEPLDTDEAGSSVLPDGQPGLFRMYIWDLSSVRRDGAMDNGIIVHEFTHGITARMTGGGTARCLQTTEAGGLGEGWSDAMAEWVQQKLILPDTDKLDSKRKQKPTFPDYVIGRYVANHTAGLRTYPYSISNITNPLRYSSVEGLDEVHLHKIGEVWANMLHNVHAALVEEHGFSENAKTDPTTSEGNVVFMHLFIDALLIQPCNPTFVDARDAWIQADQNRYAGVNRCLLWRAFASKGLGLNAANFVDDPSVPSDCLPSAQQNGLLTWFQSLGRPKKPSPALGLGEITRV